MKPKTLPVLEQCIEIGIELGFRRAFKYSDAPNDEQIKAALATAIIDQFYEWFDFPVQEIPSENREPF